MEYRSSEGNTKTYITKNVVIASGQSLSAAIDLEQLNIATILFPASWDTADITFQTSPDGATYGDLINDSGVEVKRTPTAGKAMGINMPELSGVRFLKIRSGTSGSAVNQTADRTLVLTLTNNAEAPAPNASTAVTIADGADVALGSTGDAAYTTGAGTVVSILKGIFSRLGLTKGSGNVDSSTLRVITAADGPLNTNLGTTADVAVVTDADGSISGKIRGLVKMLADVWDSSLHGLKVVQTTADNLHAVVFGYDGATNRAISTNSDGSLKVTGNYIAITATIANGASLSGEIDLGSRQLAAIFMPGTWTAANLTFQASDQTGGTFQDVYDSAGNELTAIAAASRTITDIPELGPLRFIKVRSGTTGTPVNQGGARTIILLVK